MSSFRSRLEEALSMRNMTAAELSRRTGIGEGAISQYRKGAYEATQKNLEKMAAALGVSIPWLMGAIDAVPAQPTIRPMPTTVFRPRLGAIACGEPILADQNIEGYDQVPDWVKCDFTLICRGDSMTGARIYDGDLVCIKQQETVENGQIAAVLIEDEATLKRVRFVEGGVALWPENPAYEPMIFVGEAANRVKILGLATHFISTIR